MLAPKRCTRRRALRSPKGTGNERSRCSKVPAARHAPGPRLALAFVLSRQGKLDDAIIQLRKLLERDPGNGDAWFNLGNMHRARGAFGEAARCFGRAAALRPADPDAAINLGLVLAQSDRLEDAAAALESFLARSSPHPDALLNLGQVRRALGSPEGARDSFEAALRLAPAHLGARVNRAIALAELDAEDAAEAEARSIISGHPDCAEAHLLLASLCLATGQFEEGWREYRWRPDRLRALGVAPLPSIEQLRGAAVRVSGEQGLGDVLFFLRYLPALREVAASVRLRTDPRLAAILPSAWDANRERGPEAGTIAILAGDPPALLGPAPVASLALSPEPDRVAAVKARLRRAGPPPYVGVTWEAGTRWSAQIRAGEALLRGSTLNSSAGCWRKGQEPRSCSSAIHGPLTVERSRGAWAAPRSTAAIRTSTCETRLRSSRCSTTTSA
ncbi:MAG TPA: tetratricopeptide repeat protein [Burkholderiales bacterium]|nr:tetratricopeptide repeat protein [Burkholderiales bacterium]